LNKTLSGKPGAVQFHLPVGNPEGRPEATICDVLEFNFTPRLWDRALALGEARLLANV
jgi:hypothetical protein